MSCAAEVEATQRFPLDPLGRADIDNHFLGLHVHTGDDADWVVPERLGHGDVEDEGVGMTPHPDSPGLRMGLALIAMLADSLDVRPLKPSGTELRVIFDPSA